MNSTMSLRLFKETTLNSLFQSFIFLQINRAEPAKTGTAGNLAVSTTYVVNLKELLSNCLIFEILPYY